MNNLVKKVLFVALLSGSCVFAQAQGFGPGRGFTQINFGVGVSNYGVPIYGGMDFGVSDKITIGPRISYRTYNESFYIGGGNNDFRYSITNISFRGDYHYGNHIDALPEKLDLYAGLSLGYTIWGNNYNGTAKYDTRSSRVYAALQAGARWYFSEHWAANAELSGGSLTGLDVGLSYKF